MTAVRLSKTEAPAARAGADTLLERGAIKDPTQHVHLARPGSKRLLPVSVARSLPGC